MSKAAISIELLKNRIDMITYERDMAVALLQCAVNPRLKGWEKTTRDFLASIGKLSTNELPAAEQAEYERLGE